MSRGIRVSEKHGVNPSLGICFFCGEDDGTIILPGRLKGDAEAPRRAVWTKEPCPKCKEYMTRGVVLIEATGGRENPQRTGRMWVVKEEAIHKVFPPGAMLDDTLKKRMAYIEPEVAQKIGLGTGEK